MLDRIGSFITENQNRGCYTVTVMLEVKSIYFGSQSCSWKGKILTNAREK